MSFYEIKSQWHSMSDQMILAEASKPEGLDIHHLSHASHSPSILHSSHCIFLNTMLENKHYGQTKRNCHKLILQWWTKDLTLSILSRIHPTSLLLPYKLPYLRTPLHSEVLFLGMQDRRGTALSKGKGVGKGNISSRGYEGLLSTRIITIHQG